MHIRWNWGTGIFIAIVIFIGFMIGLVYMSTKQNFDLVEKDYYPKALEYQQQIDKENNAKKLLEEVKVENLGQVIEVQFQSFFEPEDISGTITFYRPSAKNADVSFEIAPDTSNKQYFSTAQFLKGKYILQVDYQVNDVSYFEEKTVILKMF